ncbi:MAG TPA: class I SAM-dependent methyltransferase [Planctomycetota bacterium]|nr:class I SAM-dependent methyltransferase [Planctomycetota bacterium]
MATERDPTTWQLVRTAFRIRLESPAGPDALAVELDLRSGGLARRLRSSRRDEPLPRAIGLNARRPAPTVVDATAGLCRDAMVLAQLGCRVTAIERIPALAFLVDDALATAAFAGELRVLTADATAWLRELPAEAAPDVVYLDPRFATTGRAQVKKEMQACRALAGAPDDTAALFAAARAVARERVVVKRHHDLPPLGPDVAFRVAGERVRFDVHLRPTDRLPPAPVTEPPDVSGSRAP